MTVSEICEIIMAICSVIMLIGGGIWATTARFATKDQTKYLNGILETQKNELGELKELFNTHVSNEAFFRNHIEKQKLTIEKQNQTLENVDGLFRTIDSKINSGKLKVVN